MKINRIGFMPRAEVKDFSIPALPGTAAPENFAAFEPGEKNDLVRRWDDERFAVHFGILNFKAPINSRCDGVTGVADPKPFALARLAPGERTACSHQALENFRVMGGME